MKKKIITAVLGICLTTTAFGGILTTQAGGLSSILGGAAKIGGIGIVINKFRGDIKLLEPALTFIEEKTGKYQG